MNLIKLNENYSITDAFKENQVNGSVSISPEVISVSINVNDGQMTADFQKGFDFSNLSIHSASESDRVEFNAYVNGILEQVLEQFSTDEESSEVASDATPSED